MKVLAIPTDIDQYETVVSDTWLNLVESRIRDEQPDVPSDAGFVTFIQPTRTVEGPFGPMTVEPMAVFACVSPNPRHPNVTLMSTGTASLADWRAREAERTHFAGVSDPLLDIFRIVVAQHLNSLQSLREMI